MKTYTRTLHSFSTKTDEKSLIIEAFQQPRKDRVRYLAFKTFVDFVYLKPFHWIIEGPLEHASRRAHFRECNRDCTVGNTRETLDSEWKEVEMCGRVPLCARLDLKLYDFEMKNIKVLGRITLPR